MSGCEVCLLVDSDDALDQSYDAYIAGHPHATFYHTSKYKRFLLGLLTCECATFVAKREGHTVGVFPMLAQKGPLGVVLNSLPFFGSYGGVLADDAYVANALWEAASARAAGHDVLSMTVVENPFGDANGFSEVFGHACDRRVIQYTELPIRNSGEASDWLHRKIDSSARRNIKKAKKDGVSVHCDVSAMDFLAAAHREGMAEIGGRAKSQEFFDLVPAHFQPNRDYKIYVAEQGGERVAALLVFLYRHYAEYFVPATLGTARNSQPMAAILERAMCDAACSGATVWNWGGTWPTQDGVYKFKRKWAAEERPYAYRTYVRDRALLLGQTPENMMSSYPGFYVVPFDEIAIPGKS